MSYALDGHNYLKRFREEWLDRVSPLGIWFLKISSKLFFKKKNLYLICYNIVLFYVFVSWWRGMWDPSFPTWDQTHTPHIERRSLNHWTARRVPLPNYSYFFSLDSDFRLQSSGRLCFFFFTFCKI